MAGGGWHQLPVVTASVLLFALGAWLLVISLDEVAAVQLLALQGVVSEAQSRGANEHGEGGTVELDSGTLRTVASEHPCPRTFPRSV